MALDYNNSIPLYIQLKEIIQQNIQSGVYQHKIPSEREIMDQYYVSRSTVRLAVERLVQEGILEKRAGRGTFISSKHIDDWLGNLSSTTETIERIGMNPGAKLIKTEVIQLKGKLKSVTGLEEAFHIKRVRYADDIPIGVENHYYPIDLGKQLLSFDLNKVTMYDVIENEIGIQTLEAEQVISAAKVDKEDAILLNIPRTNSILIADRKLVDVDNKFVEFEHACYRADMYSFKIKLSRKNK